MKGISPNFSHFYVFAFVDVLINFWGQRSKIKVTTGNDPRNWVHTLSS